MKYVVSLRFAIIAITSVLLLACAALAITPTVSLDQAVELVTAALLPQGTDSVVIAAWGPILKGTEIRGTRELVLVAPEDGYVIFIDDHPTASLFQPVRYAFISASNGNIMVKDATSSPDNFKDYILIQTEIGDFLKNVKNRRPTTSHINPPPTRSENRWAILMSGGWDQYNNLSRYWNDLSNIYVTLSSTYGFFDDQIVVLCSDGLDPAPDQRNGQNSDPDLDGDGDDDIIGPCTLSQVDAVFAQLSLVLGDDDELFIYATDHGTNNGGRNTDFALWNHDSLTDAHFATLLADFQCQEIICTFEPCNSGGFLDNIVVPPDTIVASSACRYDESSYVLPNYEYDTYSFYWTAAVSWVDAYGNPVNADGDRNGIITMDEAFAYARNRSQTARQHPQYSDYPRRIGEEISLWQVPTTFTRTFGGSGWDDGHSVQQTSDGGYIIAGSTQSYGAGNYDVYLIKTDAAGNQVWQRTFGGSNNDYGESVQQTSDGGYIIAGYTDSYGAGNEDVYLIKTDAAGNQTWQCTFGGSGYDEGYSVQQTSNGGYVIAGYTCSFVVDVYLIKTDANGNSVWQRTFGGSNWDFGRSVQQTSDGGYIIAGYTQSYGAGNYDVYLIKTDAAGNQVWQRTFGGSNWDEGYSVQQTSDGGYVIAGRAEFYGAGYWDVYLIKTDAAGNLVWQRTFGGSNYDYGCSVDMTADGGYIIAGGTLSYGAGYSDVYLIKTDYTGNLTWQRTFGGSSEDWGYCVRQTSDGGYVIAGETYSYGAGSGDVYLIKTDANGNVNPFMDFAGAGNVGATHASPLQPAQFALSGVFPNPFNPSTVVSFELRVASKTRLDIFDISGRLVTTLINGWREAGSHEVTFDGSGLPSGVYLARLQAGDYTGVQKLVLLK